MEMVQDYDVCAYATLPAFDTAQKMLSIHCNILGELGTVILKHEMQDSVGVSLLHKHFELEDHQRVVRKYSGKSISAQGQHESGNLKASQLRLVNKLWASYFVPIEFIDADTFSNVVVSQSSNLVKNNCFLADFSEKLRQLNVEEVFGLATLNVSTQLGVDCNQQIIFEYQASDSHRASLFKIIDRPLRDEIEGPALWTFSKSQQGSIKTRTDYVCSGCIDTDKVFVRADYACSGCINEH